ncbi:hypothetical protein [uncultured Hyphomonas sp.]|uniref:hypothetical protein n=1 Tax=uncultured Hyphomonas sp. TaxID=225298 RepID=UPI002AAA78BB|nr:hypothetical protein [uncultured Hyphomonas sp.]
MSLFGLFGKKQPAFDSSEGDPNVATGLGLIEAGDGAALGALYAGLPPADRVHLIDGMGLLTEIAASLPPLDAHPAMPAIQGGLCYIWAHRLRGYDTADRTSDGQVMDMAQMAFHAQDLLAQAAEQTPLDSALYAFRIRAMMLTGGKEGAFDAICAGLKATGEANLLAEMARLNYLTQKWHGSHEEMYGVADAAAANPPNAAFLSLHARAWIEEWLYETGMNDVKEEKAAFRARRESEEFRADIAALDDRFRALLVDLPAPSRVERQFAHNNFAMLFHLNPDKARLKYHLEAIGDTPTSMPWGYVFGENVPKKLNKLRKSVGLAQF